MADEFRNHPVPLTGPFTAGAAVAPSDTADLPTTPRALYCTGSGNVSVILLHGGTVTLPLVAGVALPARVTRVRATGTTATGIVAVW